MRLASICIIAFAQLLPTSAAAAPERIVVVPLRAGPGIDELAASSATEALATEVQRARPGTNVVTQAEISTAIGLARSKQLAGCAETATCMVEIAGALDAQLLVTGTLRRDGAELALDTQLVRMPEIVVERRSTDRVDASAEGATSRLATQAAAHLFAPEDEVLATGTPRIAVGVRVRALSSPYAGNLPVWNALQLSLPVGFRLNRTLWLGIAPILGSIYGASLRAEVMPLWSDLWIHPVVELEVPVLFFGDDARYPSQTLWTGVSASLTAELVPVRWFAFRLGIPATFWFLRPAGAVPGTFGFEASASLRF